MSNQVTSADQARSKVRIRRWGPTRIKSYMKFMGWTHAQLGSELDCGASTVGGWLYGKGVSPGLELKLEESANKNGFTG